MTTIASSERGDSEPRRVFMLMPRASWRRVASYARNHATTVGELAQTSRGFASMVAAAFVPTDGERPARAWDSRTLWPLNVKQNGQAPHTQRPETVAEVTILTPPRFAAIRAIVGRATLDVVSNFCLPGSSALHFEELQLIPEAGIAKD